MKYTVLTTMNRAILDSTGRAMLASLARWPVEVDIAVAFEGDIFEFGNFEDEFGSHVKCFDFLSEDTALDDWMDRYRHHPGQDRLKRCAWRFAYKSFAVTGIGMDLDTDVLIWLDADTYTYRELPIEELGVWLPYEKKVSFLGREGNISECGFVMYDLRDKKVRNLLHDWRRLYTTGKLFKLKEWNDCYAFDWARQKWLATGEWENLTPWASGYQHVFINSPIGAYMDHMKGSRKGGKSRHHDLINGRISQHFLDYLEAK